jgi:glycosyltransferase involved in cell wall biosynthesis
MKIPSLALCIPAYNAAAFLPRLLKSVRSQTIPFDEMWLYDDRSSDNTSQIAEEFGVNVVRGDINRGCSFGKNTLASKTNCDWIHFHDADDALYPNFVEQCHQWMKQANPPDVVLFNYESRDDKTDAKIGIREFDNDALKRDAIAYTIREQINPFCGLYRREAFLKAGGYDLDPLVLYNEDVAMHCQIARAGLKFAADPTVTVINYCRTNSMSSANQIKCAKAQFEVMKKSAEALTDKYHTYIAERLWEIAGVSAAYLNWENADACVSLAVSLAGKVPQKSNRLFQNLCRVNPHLAIRTREYSIRSLKPNLRRQA